MRSATRSERVRSLCGRAVRLVLFAAALPSVVYAHTRLLRSSPAAGVTLDVAPRDIRLTFSEAPEPAFTSIILTAADGSRMALSTPSLSSDAPATIICEIRGELTAGRYTISWNAGGSDGHPVKGTFAFTVRAASTGSVDVPPSALAQPNPAASRDTAATHHDPALMPMAADEDAFGSESPLYVAVRWLQYVGLLLVIGSAAFGTLVVGTMRRFHSVDVRFVGGARARAARLALSGVVIVLVSAALRLFAQVYAMHGTAAAFTWTNVASMLRETSWGTGWVLQIIALIVAGAGFVIASRQSITAQSAPSEAPRASLPTWGWTVAALGAMALAFTPGLASHAASAPRWSALAMVADGLHVLGAGGWLGSLSAVVLAGIPAALVLPEDARGPAVANLINAFSPTALVFAGIVATTGVFAAWLHVGSIDALWMTTYGQVLLAKLAVLSLLAGTGAFNWLRMKPALGSLQAAPRIRRTASIELLVGVIVLIITAVLVATPAGADMQM